MNEHGTVMFKLKGTGVLWRALKDVVGTPGYVDIPDARAAVVKIHLHVNEGRQAYKRNEDGSAEIIKFRTGPSGLEGDIRNSWNGPGRGNYLDVVVSKNQIHFYNSTGVIVSYNRK